MSLETSQVNCIQEVAEQAEELKVEMEEEEREAFGHHHMLLSLV